MPADTPKNVRCTASVPEDVAKRVEVIAAEEHRSLAAQLGVLVMEGLKSYDDDQSRAGKGRSRAGKGRTGRG